MGGGCLGLSSFGLIHVFIPSRTAPGPCHMLILNLLCLSASQVITIPQQQAEKDTCTGIGHGPAFDAMPGHAGEEAPAFPETAKAPAAEEPATLSPEAAPSPPPTREAPHETSQGGQPTPQPGDSSSFSTAGETDVSSSLTPEKELEDNAATGSSMQSAPKCCSKGQSGVPLRNSFALMVNFQPLSPTEGTRWRRATRRATSACRSWKEKPVPRQRARSSIRHLPP